MARDQWPAKQEKKEEFHTEGAKVGGQRTQSRKDPRAQAGVPVPQDGRTEKCSC